MLCRTRKCHVVFTQAFPILERFAQEHFLPSNPLSTSPLWLDEDDFGGILMAAKHHKQPYPLHIDPHAHHPVLSRFAQKAAPTSGRRARALGGSAAASGVAPSVPSITGVEGHMQNSDIAETAQMAKGSDGTLSRPPQRRRGRPRNTSVVSVEPVTNMRATELDPSQYQVPICSMNVVKPLYLLNMDQLYLTPYPEVSWSAGYVENVAGGIDGCANQPSSLPPLHSAQADGTPYLRHNHLYIRSHKDTTTMSLLPPSLSRDYVLDGAHSNPLVSPFGEVVASGVRALQLKFPNPTEVSPGQMLSIFTRKRYSDARQRDLRNIASKHGYQSQWWGTKRQWDLVGAAVRPGEVEHVVPIEFPTKLVHISLIENASAVLQRGFITPRRRKFVYVFDDNETLRDGDGVSAVEDGVVARGLGAGGSVQDTTKKNRSVNFLQNRLQKDMKSMNYRLPLYLMRRQIASLGLSLRSDARGVSLSVGSSAGAATAKEEEELTEVSALLAGKTLASIPKAPVFRCWYHISQVHFPSSYLLSSAVLSAEMTNPGVPLHGATGVRLPYPELSYDSLVDHHPDIAALLVMDRESHTAAAAESVLHAECKNEPPPPARTAPGTPLQDAAHDSTETRHHHSAKEKARGPATEDVDELRIVHFVATHASPRAVKGRHLWFMAEDVLAVNGIVEVNSAPVEVRDETVGTASIAGGGVNTGADAEASTVPGGEEAVLFNVECLTDPDEALRKLSLPFSAS
jgi:hypothetical protein